MPQTIDVQTGEVKAGGKDTLLFSTAIGSCIAVAALETNALVGGIAHIMLPGKSPENPEKPHTRYAHDGFSALLESVRSMGGAIENLNICIAGGANVLNSPDDSICRENVASVLEQCERYNLPVVARSLGGYLRRRVMVNVGQLTVSCGIGDQADFILWSSGKEITV